MYFDPIYLPPHMSQIHALSYTTLYHPSSSDSSSLKVTHQALFNLPIYSWRRGFQRETFTHQGPHPERKRTLFPATAKRSFASGGTLCPSLFMLRFCPAWAGTDTLCLLICKAVVEWKKLRKINRLYLTLKDNINQNWNQYLEIKVTLMWQRLVSRPLVIDYGSKSWESVKPLNSFQWRTRVYYLCNIHLQVVR